MSDSRAEFEAWIASHGGSVDRLDAGEYRSAPTECAWNAWQAARAQSREYERGFSAACKLQADIAQPERKLTDAEAQSLLIRMADHVDSWSEAQEHEPSSEQCSGEALRFILAAQPAAATVPEWISSSDDDREMAKLEDAIGQTIPELTQKEKTANG